MNILDEIVEQKKAEIAKLPARIIAAGDLRDAMLERGEPRDFTATLRAASRLAAPKRSEGGNTHRGYLGSLHRPPPERCEP